MACVKLVLEYHGGGFAGWAAQPGLRTVEGELSRALETALGPRVALSVAGRTDAGVHAWGQVASFTVDRQPPDPEELARSLNGLLADDVAVMDVEVAGDGFDARRDAISRTYCYRVLVRPSPSPFERGRALWWPHALDERALHESAGALPGTHDFTAFTPTQTDHIRFERDVTWAGWRRRSHVLEFWIEADTFMRHMVRVIVGTMLEVGSGRRTVDDFAVLLAGAPRSKAGPTADAHGLYLAEVRYQAPGCASTGKKGSSGVRLT
jgi:tRNA pseudouridine38-40 synthase